MFFGVFLLPVLFNQTLFGALNLSSKFSNCPSSGKGNGKQYAWHHITVLPTVFEASRITVTRPTKSGITVQRTVLSIFWVLLKCSNLHSKSGIGITVLRTVLVGGPKYGATRIVYHYPGKLFHSTRLHFSAFTSNSRCKRSFSERQSDDSFRTVPMQPLCQVWEQMKTCWIADVTK